MSLFGVILCGIVLVWLVFVEIPCVASEGEFLGMILYRHLKKQKEQTVVAEKQPKKEKHILEENVLVEMTDIYPGTVCYITHFYDNPSYDFETNRYTLKSVDGYYYDSKQGWVYRPNNWVTMSRKRFRVIGNIHYGAKVKILSKVKGISSKLYKRAIGTVIGYNLKNNLYIVRLELPFNNPKKGNMETKMKNVIVFITEQNLQVLP